MRTLITLLLVGVVASIAQAGVVVQYDFGPVELLQTQSPTTLGPNVTAGLFTFTGNYSGPHPSPAFTPHAGFGRAYYARGWDDASYTDYFGFSVTVAPGFVLNVTDLTFESQRDVDGPTLAAVAWVNGAPVTIEDGFTPTTGWQTHVADDNAPLGLVGTVDFRIYGKGGLDHDDPWIVDTVTLNGDVVPEPAVLSVLGLGALLGLARRKRRRS